MKPGLRIDHGKRGDGVPCYVPDNLFPASDLDVILNYEFRVAFLQNSNELIQSGIFDGRGNFGIGEEPNLGVFGLDVGYDSGGGLCCSDPGLRFSVGVRDEEGERTYDAA
jgi:hypothetical protein